MTYILNTNQLTTNSLNNITLGPITTGAGSNGTYYTTGTVTSNPVMYVNQASTSLEVNGSVVINGQDLEERLKTIEYVLGLPERDVTMESKYPSLKKKYDEYVNALAKYRTFDAIKGDDNE
jgi:hypothetical protein